MYSLLATQQSLAPMQQKIFVGPISASLLFLSSSFFKPSYHEPSLQAGTSEAASHKHAIPINGLRETSAILPPELEYAKR